MNNHKTPTNGYLQSVQKLPWLYIAAAFLSHVLAKLNWVSKKLKNPEVVPSVRCSFIGIKNMFSIWVSAFQQCFYLNTWVCQSRK